MVVEVLTGPPGCGKSHRMREEAIAQPGLYVFFMPTLGLLKEQIDRFREAAPSLSLFVAHSGEGRGTVQRKLDDALAATSNTQTNHAVVFTTHDALISRDLSGFAGWHARVDEAPNATDSGHVTVGQSWRWLDEHFDLSPVDDEWWLANPKKSLPGWKEIEADSLLKPLIDLIKRAASPSGLFVDTGQWSAKRKVGWAAIWTPLSLRHFASSTIAGASYDNSLGALVSRRLFGPSLHFAKREIPMTRTGHATVRVHFFAEAHEPSTTLWDSSEGRFCIKKVADHLGGVPNMGYWSGNAEVLKLMEWRVGGEMTRPKVEGREEWVGHRCCAFIYSSGPTPQDRPIMDRFGITEAQVRRAREEEDTLQYVMRGAVRRPAFEGDYDIYVYSKRQADTLAARLQASAVGMIQVLPVVEAGLIDRQVKGGPPKSPQRANAAGGPITVTGRSGKQIKPKSFARSTQRATAAKSDPPKPRGRPRKRP